MPQQSPLNQTQFLILLVLLDGPLHGYGIVKEIAARTDSGVRLEPGNLYRFVKRLMELGYIADAPQARSDESGRDARRRYFSLTRKGREALEGDAARMRSLVLALESRQGNG
ncbi:MAG: PadR family transcriptional regulator [Longimicrobiales bacterium]